MVFFAPAKEGGQLMGVMDAVARGIVQDCCTGDSDAPAPKGGDDLLLCRGKEFQ